MLGVVEERDRPRTLRDARSGGLIEFDTVNAITVSQSRGAVQHCHRNSSVTPNQKLTDQIRVFDIKIIVPLLHPLIRLPLRET
jgi:hypothetical protein